MKEFIDFLLERGLTLPQYQKLSAEKQTYLKETWVLEQGGNRPRRYLGVDETPVPRRFTQKESSFSWVWLAMTVAALGVGAWLFVMLVKGAKTQIEAGSPSPAAGSVSRG